MTVVRGGGSQRSVTVWGAEGGRLGGHRPRRLRCGGRTEWPQTAVHAGAGLTSGLVGVGYRARIAAKAGTFAGPVGTVSATVVGGGVGEGIEDLLQMRIWPG
jgi:hypothetical protein